MKEKRSPMNRIYKLQVADITKITPDENELQFICSSKKQLKERFMEYFKDQYHPRIRSIEYFAVTNDHRKLMSPKLPK